MTDRALVITLDQATSSALQANGYHLYAFRPVVSSNKSGVPLVWTRLDTYLQSISIDFTSIALTAYISTDAIAVNQAVGIGVDTAVVTGQTVTVSAGGTLSVADNAPAGDIYIVSNATAAYTCGLAAEIDTQSVTPFCAFSLYSRFEVTMQPADAIFVMWATSTYDTAVYMQQSLGPGLLVAFDGTTQRTVAYDITDGWQTDNAGWAVPVASGANLVTTLILDPGHNHPVVM
jgi:hypothetical protein